MTPGQILWLARIGAVGVFLVLVFSSGYRSGAKAVQRDWDGSKAQIELDKIRLLQENAQRIADAAERQRETNLTISNDHEKALNELRQKYDADIAAARASGGLRLPRSVCSGSITTGAKATSAGGSDEAATGTIALPETVTSDLFDFARQADEVTETARSCQYWIRSNQFYGDQIPTE